MLSRLALMVQAAVLDGQFFDPVPPFDDGGVASEVGVGGRYAAEVGAWTGLWPNSGGSKPHQQLFGQACAV